MLTYKGFFYTRKNSGTSVSLYLSLFPVCSVFSPLNPLTYCSVVRDNCHMTFLPSFLYFLLFQGLSRELSTNLYWGYLRSVEVLWETGEFSLPTHYLLPKMWAQNLSQYFVLFMYTFYTSNPCLFHTSSVSLREKEFLYDNRYSGSKDLSNDEEQKFGPILTKVRKGV